MPGTVIGAKHTAEVLKKKDPDFYRKVGSIGGRAKHNRPRGFASNKELARKAGRIGGIKSRRGPSLKTVQRIKKAKEMHDQGATLKEISEVLGIAVSTACNYLR